MLRRTFLKWLGASPLMFLLPKAEMQCGVVLPDTADSTSACTTRWKAVTLQDMIRAMQTMPEPAQKPILFVGPYAHVGSQWFKVDMHLGVKPLECWGPCPSMNRRGFLS